MPTTTTSAARNPAAVSKQRGIPRGLGKHHTWWRSELPGLVERINQELASDDAPAEPLAVLIEPRWVTFLPQSEIVAGFSSGRFGEKRFGLNLPTALTPDDLCDALQGEALRPLVEAHLWLQELQVPVLLEREGMQSHAAQVFIAHLTAPHHSFRLLSRLWPVIPRSCGRTRPRCQRQ